MKEILPTNNEVPRELFFPASWNNAIAWTNGHIITTLLPDGVNEKEPSNEINKHSGYFHERVINGYKKPINADVLRHEKKIKLSYSHSDFDWRSDFLEDITEEKNYLQHTIVFKSKKPCASIDANYYAMIVGMYGINIDFYYGGKSTSAVSVYKDDNLVALIMPIRQDKYNA
jgi:hypothetical protein